MGAQQSVVVHNLMNKLQDFDIGSRVEEVDHLDSDTDMEGEEYHTAPTRLKSLRSQWRDLRQEETRVQQNSLRHLLERNRLLREQNEILRKIVRTIQHHIVENMNS